MEIKAIEARVTGKVQGVWFRKYTQDKARTLGLKGYVQNEPDGSVKVHAEGNPEALGKLAEWLHEGSPLSSVEHVWIKEVPAKGFENFVINK